jgi:hypothetical protein
MEEEVARFEKNFPSKPRRKSIRYGTKYFERRRASERNEGFLSTCSVPVGLGWDSHAEKAQP